ncbi:J domain-containing protein [Crocosphaera sp. XPORK-15E]|nr:J domain-containing protein [Crocosphaera sp. XPORK-15E]MEA5533931.1 J domain-containing protein [Crocosphaera sp. XPORK-15E]
MPFANSHYAILGLDPSASVREIRRAYRELSKRYHPDTTQLPFSVATPKFQRLNEAYGILSNPERRSLYDLTIGYSRWNVIQVPIENKNTTESAQYSRSAYLDASDRPLSGGEIFALFILGLTLVGCLVLAIFVGILRGDEAIPPTALPQDYAFISGAKMLSLFLSGL